MLMGNFCHLLMIWCPALSSPDSPKSPMLEVPVLPFTEKETKVQGTKESPGVYSRRILALQILDLHVLGYTWVPFSPSDVKSGEFNTVSSCSWYTDANIHTTGSQCCCFYSSGCHAFLFLHFSLRDVHLFLLDSKAWRVGVDKEWILKPSR